jgi:DNA polymerase III delta subunit
VPRHAPDSPPPTISAETRFLILHGKERFLQDEFLRQLRTALEKAHGKDGVDTVRFDGAQGPRIIADVLDECRSFGLMQQHKVVLVDNADALLKADESEDTPKPKRGHAPATPRALLEAYAEDPSSSATLVLRAGTWRPGNLDKAVTALGPRGAVMKCDPPDWGVAINWAQARAKVRHRTSIDADTAAMLVEAVGQDLGRIDNELEKLALAAGGEGQPITPELVETMVGRTRQEEFWTIQSALLSPDAARPLTQLTELLEISRHDPVPIGWAYVETARKIHLMARGLAAGQNPQALAGPLKIWGPGKDEMLAAIGGTARALGPAAATRLLGAAITTDASNKSGVGEPVRNLEVLTIKFAMAAQRGARAGQGAARR